MSNLKSRKFSATAFFLFVIILILLPLINAPPVPIESVDSAIVGGSSTTLTVGVTSFSGLSDSLLLVGVGIRSATATVTSIDFGDTTSCTSAQSLISDANSNHSGAETSTEFWYVTSPTDSHTTPTVCITITESTNFGAGVWVLSGINTGDVVENSTGINNLANASIQNNNSLAGTSADSLVLDITSMREDKGIWTPNSGQVLNFTVESGGGSKLEVRSFGIYASDSQTDMNWTIDKSAQYSKSIISINEASGVDTFPQWSDNSTNSTVAGTNIEHRITWTDDSALSGFIFSFDNGSAVFVNDSFVLMTGTSNQSNVSKVVNSTVGTFIQWKVYTNDSVNQLNATDTFNYTSTAADSCSCPSINTNFEINMSDSCEIFTDCDIGTGNITFVSTGNATFNSTITANNMGQPPASSTLFIGAECRVILG